MIDRDDHPAVNCDRVVTDDEEVGRMATSHLLEQGRKAIAHIAGPAIVHARRRTAGYREALRAHGIRARAEWIVRGGFMDADGYRAMKKLLAVKPRSMRSSPRTIPSAIGAMKAIWEAGRRVPDDIAVVGAGDIALGDLLRVPLTTVSWSRDDLGKRAAELILERIDPEPPAGFTARRHPAAAGRAPFQRRAGGALGMTIAGVLLAAAALSASPGPPIDLAAERARVLAAARQYLQEAPVTVTASHSPRSAGGLHDFFSEGDYWWPDPDHPDGPYIQRDGMTNPANFVEHRRALDAAVRAAAGARRGVAIDASGRIRSSRRAAPACVVRRRGQRG